MNSIQNSTSNLLYPPLLFPVTFTNFIVPNFAPLVIYLRVPSIYPSSPANFNSNSTLNSVHFVHAPRLLLPSSFFFPGLKQRTPCASKLASLSSLHSAIGVCLPNVHVKNVSTFVKLKLACHFIKKKSPTPIA